MKKLYFIYWDNTIGLTGNTIMKADFKNQHLTDIIKDLYTGINNKLIQDGYKVWLGNITIKFMCEIK